MEKKKVSLAKIMPQFIHFSNSKKLNLRSHQIKYFDCIENANFGLIKQTCGSGKTLEQAGTVAATMHWAEQEGRKAVMMVCSHRLLLNTQLIDEYAKFITNDNLVILNLSTGKLIENKKEYGKKKIVSDIGTDTIKRYIKYAMTKPNAKHVLIITTSVRMTMKVGKKVNDDDKTDVVFDIFKNSGKKLDLFMIDEGHKVLDAPSYKFIKDHSKRMYAFTATPKNNQSTIVDLPTLDCVLSFADALKFNYVVRPKLWAIENIGTNKNSKTNMNASCITNAFIDLKNDVKNTGNSPVLIAYVDSIEEVHKNSKKLKNIKQLKAVDIYSFASKKNIENGLQEIGGCWKNDIEMKKEEMLDDLKTNKNSKIIINDQMLTEGIDVKGINGVYIGCKKSDASLYQAIMRGCRTTVDGKKDHFNIYIKDDLIYDSSTQRCKKFLENLIQNLDGELDFGELRVDVDNGAVPKKIDKKENINKIEEVTTKISKFIKQRIEEVKLDLDFNTLTDHLDCLTNDERMIEIFDIIENKNSKYYKYTDDLEKKYW